MEMIQNILVSHKLSKNIPVSFHQVEAGQEQWKEWLKAESQVLEGEMIETEAGCEEGDKTTTTTNNYAL